MRACVRACGVEVCACVCERVRVCVNVCVSGRVRACHPRVRATPYPPTITPSTFLVCTRE
jgi:hypothetical protein